jgi:hypothetical protein
VNARPSARSAITAAIGMTALLVSLLTGFTPAQAAGTATVSARVVIEPSTPATEGQANVTLYTWDGSQWVVWETVATSASGQVSFGGLDNGTSYLLETNVPGGGYPPVWGRTSFVPVPATTFSRTGAITTDGQQVSVGDIVMKPYRSVSGSVTLPSGAVPADGAVQVTLQRRLPSETQYTSLPDPAMTTGGNFSFSGILPYEYKLVFDYLPDDSVFQTSRTVNLAAASTVPPVVVAMEHAYSVSGHVDLGEVGSPAPAGVAVTVRAGGCCDAWSTTTDAAGDFRVAGMYPGSKTLYVTYGAGDQWIRSEIAFTLANNVDPVIDVVLERWPAVEGIVTDRDGNPLSGISVIANLYDQTNGNYVTQVTTTTDSAGAYWMVTALFDVEIFFFDPAGVYATVGWDDVNPYYLPDLLVMERNTVIEDVDAKLFRAGTMSGTVTTPGYSTNDRLYLGVEVMVYDYYSEQWVGTGDSYPVSAGGAFSIPDVYPGSYRLAGFYYGPNGFRYALSNIVTVAAGQTLAIGTITLSPPAPVNLTAPTVSGGSTVGATWSLNPGTWAGTPTIIQAWLRCNQPVTTNVVGVPAGCVATGARGTSYVSTSSDAGKYITAQVAASNYAGTTNIVALTTIATAGPVAPAATVKPTVSGSAAVGSTWTLNKGTWTGTPTPTIVQAWLRCNAPVTTNVAAVPAGCVATGARGTTYVSTSYDAGKYITAQVAGINSAGTTNVVALTTVATTGPTIPAATVKPTVSGSAAVGSTWTLNTGTWSGSPTKIVHAWLRCNAPVTTNVVAVPAGCVATGAKGTTYVSTSYDAGKYITAQVAAINAAGTTNVVALTTVATTGPTVPAATVKPTVSGSAAVGSTWTLNTGTWSGSPTKIVQAWLRCNAPVATNVVAVPPGCVATGARGTTYISTSYDAGKYITAQVAAINAAGTTNVVALTTVATTGPMAPAATVAPTVTGNAAIGSTWTLTTGTWSGSPTKIIQAWLRCTSPVTTNVVAVPAGCVATGAKGTTYISTSSDVGKYITAQVAAFNAVGVTNIVALTTVTTE